MKGKWATIYMDKDQQRADRIGHGRIYGDNFERFGTMTESELFSRAHRVIDISGIENIFSKLPFSSVEDCIAKGGIELGVKK